MANDHTESLKDVSQLGLFAAMGSLGYVFWVLGGMEMVERLAYYGVRSVSGLYVTDPVSKGGLGVSAEELGSIFMIWALVQSLVPALMGGLSDRFGYKETIFASTVVKIVGYLIMAFYPSFWGFTIGAIILATGTGIFKPGIQGTLAKVCTRQNSSMAWGIFYQTVNIGGWLGPLMAAQLRQLDWSNVFFACAGIISINFLLLLVYKEPGKAERQLHRKKIALGEVEEETLWKASLRELVKPHLAIFFLLMCGFWFMFNALFDVLPLHIRDWVDTSVIVTGLFGSDGTQSGFWQFILGMNLEGTRIMPEGLLNVNAGLIMFTCFLFAQLSGKFKAINSMIFGTLLCGLSFTLMGFTTAGWVVFAGIIFFSMGEMFSSPKFLEFIGNIAPGDKKAMYLGFANLPMAVGWVLEAAVIPSMYGQYSAKDTLAREMLRAEGMPQGVLELVPQGDAFTRLVDFTGLPAEQLSEVLYQANNVGMVWYLCAAVAVATAMGLVVYGIWMKKLLES